MSQRMSVVELMNMKTSSQPNIIMSISENDFQPTQSTNDDDFLADLSNDKFVSKKEVELNDKEVKKLQKKRDAEDARQARLFRKQEADEKRAEKLKAKQEKQALKEATKEKHSLFLDDDETNEPLLGKEKLLLLEKIAQYKLLFSNNKKVQAMKVKRNASTEELLAVLNELDAFVSIDACQAFATQSILQAIKVTEVISSNTRWNISGLSHLLSKNENFNTLVKRCYLKYKVFDACPLETQLLFCVMASAYVCVEKNRTNQPINLDKQIDPALF